MKVCGTKLRNARLAADLRVEDVAAAADLGKRRIYQLEETGGSMSLNDARAVAKRLGVKLEEIAR